MLRFALSSSLWCEFFGTLPSSAFRHSDGARTALNILFSSMRYSLFYHQLSIEGIIEFHPYICDKKLKKGIFHTECTHQLTWEFASPSIKTEHLRGLLSHY